MESQKKPPLILPEFFRNFSFGSLGLRENRYAKFFRIERSRTTIINLVCDQKLTSQTHNGLLEEGCSLQTIWKILLGQIGFFPCQDCGLPSLTTTSFRTIWIE